MFVDASAIVAILVLEADAASLQARLDEAADIHTSAIATYEATLAIARVLNISVAAAEVEVANFVSETGAQVVPITAEIGRDAVRVFERFGRGRHRAQLNMGDCFAYACGRALGVMLLYKGDDFAQTDIAPG